MSEEKEHSKPEETSAPRKARFWKVCLEALKELALGLFSSDRPTRRMSAFFFASLFAMVFVLIFGTIQLKRVRSAKSGAAAKASHQLGDAHKGQGGDDERRKLQISLGIYMIELKPLPDQRPARSVMNLAEIELFAECDSKETREYIEAHLVQARGNVSSLFTSMDRNELLSKEGKRRLRKLVLERLNLWLPKGSTVQDVFITKLILN